MLHFEVEVDLEAAVRTAIEGGWRRGTVAAARSKTRRHPDRAYSRQSFPVPVPSRRVMLIRALVREDIPVLVDIANAVRREFDRLLSERASSGAKASGWFRPGPA
jgi:hypothetical protein